MLGVRRHVQAVFEFDPEGDVLESVGDDGLGVWLVVPYDVLPARAVCYGFADLCPVAPELLPEALAVVEDEHRVPDVTGSVAVERTREAPAVVELPAHRGQRFAALAGAIFVGWELVDDEHPTARDGGVFQPLGTVVVGHIQVGFDGGPHGLCAILGGDHLTAQVGCELRAVGSPARAQDRQGGQDEGVVHHASSLEARERLKGGAALAGARI